MKDFPSGTDHLSTMSHTKSSKFSGECLVKAVDEGVARKIRVKNEKETNGKGY